MYKSKQKQAKKPVFNSFFFSKKKEDNSPNQNVLAYQDKQELNRIKQKNERNTFRQRFFPLTPFLFFATFLLLIWSAMTESSFIVAGFMGMTSSWGITIFLTFLLVLLLELSKFYLGSYVLRFIVCGWLSESW